MYFMLIFPSYVLRIVMYELYFGGFIFITFVNNNLLVLDHSFFDVSMLDSKLPIVSIISQVIELFLYVKAYWMGWLISNLFEQG